MQQIIFIGKLIPFIAHSQHYQIREKYKNKKKNVIKKLLPKSKKNDTWNLKYHLSFNFCNKVIFLMKKLSNNWDVDLKTVNFVRVWQEI